MSHDGKLHAHFIALRGGGDAPRYQRQQPPTVHKTYCILITPRSGSTWLTRRIARLAVLSCPEEYFNVEEFGNTLKFNPGRDIYEVFDIVAHKACTNTGIFGFEMSYFDLEEFEREAPLLDVMLGKRYFFQLSRRNFVAQAISLYTAVESRVFHAYSGAGRPQRAAIPYDDDKIMYWLCHILQQEYGTQRWLRTNRIEPFQLWYEELLDDIDGAIARIARHLDVDLSTAKKIDIPQTERITTDEACGYEIEFRGRHWQFCGKWEAMRGTAPCLYDEARRVPTG
jgi:trehalose 2-sulfotransferase